MGLRYVYDVLMGLVSSVAPSTIIGPFVPARIVPAWSLFSLLKRRRNTTAAGPGEIKRAAQRPSLGSPGSTQTATDAHLP
jgi:hypothetical protein